MRQRRGRVRSSCDAPFPTNLTTCFSIPDKKYDFWSEHTEQSGRDVLGLMTCFFWPVCAMMSVVHTLSGNLELGSHEMLVSLPNFIVFGIVWYRKPMLQSMLRAWPVVLGSIVQVAAHAFCICATVAGALCMPTELMQHRVFFSCYFTCLVFSSWVLFVPFPVYLSLLCPLYLSGWFLFHSFANFLPPTCVCFGPITIAANAYLRYLENQELERAFEAREALKKERQRLQTMQDSLQGILSSIFDASCSCDSNGLLLECSPYLQEVLDCSPIAETGEDEGPRTVLNLCSFAATDGERQRLQAFLKNAMGSARQQAAKIECYFHNKFGGLMEASLYAIVLRAAAPSWDEQDVLFIALQTRSTDLDVCTQVTEQNIQASGEAPPEVTTPLACIEDSSLFMNFSLLDEMQSSNAPKDSGFLDEALSLASFDSINRLGTLGSLSLSASVPGSSHAFDDAEIPKRLSTSVLNSVESVEARTAVAVGTVDAEAQTIGTEARPPVLRRALTDRRVLSKKKHRIVWQAFKATPRDTIEQCIFINAMSINPRCPPACCIQHTLLRYLRHEITSMLKTSPCSNTRGGEATVQCLGCLCLQERLDEEEFVCDLCCGTQACGANPAFASPPSSTAADHESG